MNAKDYLFCDFIKGRDKFFLVPYYQRKYTWDSKKQVKELINDLKEFIKNNNTQFILGALITKKRKNEKQQDWLVLVDGQQRVTTFLIMICSLIKVNKNFEEDGKQYIRDLKNIIDIEDDSKFKLERIDDQNVIKQILNNEINLEKNADSNYVKVFNYCCEEFEKLPFQEQKQFFYKALCKIKIANIELDECEDENLVFESFNSKGKPLSSSELIKNYLMMNLESNNINQEHIKFFENNFLEGFKTPNDLEDFWRQFLNLYVGKLTTKNSKDMYLEFKNTFGVLDINDEFIDSLIEEKLIWDYLFNMRTNDKTITKDRILYNQNLLSYYSLLHAIIKRNSIINNNKKLEIINLDLINYAISFLSRLVVSRTLLSFGRVEGNRTWAKLGHELYKSQNDFKEDFNSIVKEFLETSTSKYRMPSFDEIFQIDKRDLYTDHKGNLKWIFVSIEENMSKVRKSLNEIDKFQIEHIFPQKPTKEQINKWEIEVTDELWFEWKDTLGNLSLIESSTNKKASNKFFDHKQEILKNHSYLKINKMIYEYNQWNLETLKNRAKELLLKIKEIWNFN